MKELYSQGDWSVSSLYNDTIKDPKSLSIPDLSYDTDYSVQRNTPGDAIIGNTTSSYLWTPETIRYAGTNVRNIYENTNVDPTYFAPVKGGRQVLAEVTELYMASNDKTGADVILPCKGRIVLRFPTGGVVGEALISDLIGRTIAAAFGTGSVTASRVIELAQDSMLPKGL